MLRLLLIAYNRRFTVITSYDIIGGNLIWNKIHLGTYGIDSEKHIFSYSGSYFFMDI